MLLLSIWLFSFLPFAWWWYPALILVPDLSMIGYVFNNKMGAITYNVAMDRMLGYGLKYFSGFKQSHLGEL